jgi:hypothetical protein
MGSKIVDKRNKHTYILIKGRETWEDTHVDGNISLKQILNLLLELEEEEEEDDDDDDDDDDE